MVPNFSMNAIGTAILLVKHAFFFFFYFFF